MASKHAILYKASVKNDLRKLDRSIAKRILNKIESELSENPHKGEALKGEFAGLFKYRVGDYRVIFTIAPDGILILRISHRKESYR
ncbi:MAG: type II toxin-antitoxin system RelE/ParE family toxin [Deltaproteobacteria bacterium]|nr:type II toxin-antitoxin system RelE/ParE family toxin [Deltaproteobacteria bacterium]